MDSAHTHTHKPGQRRSKWDQIWWWAWQWIQRGWCISIHTLLSFLQLSLHCMLLLATTRTTAMALQHSHYHAVQIIPNNANNMMVQNKHLCNGGLCSLPNTGCWSNSNQSGSLIKKQTGCFLHRKSPHLAFCRWTWLLAPKKRNLYQHAESVKQSMKQACVLLKVLNITWLIYNRRNKQMSSLRRHKTAPKTQN